MVNLQKQVQEKDDTLRDISEKLSRKSEECESLMEERDIMRSKSSFDLRQVGLKSANTEGVGTEMDSTVSVMMICS